MAVSHTHPDHIGNVEMFPTAMLYVQKAEYEWPGANNQPRFKAEHPVTKLEGDRDVFGDGSVHPLDAGTYARSSVALGEAAEDRRDRAVRRRRSFPREELG